MFRLYDVSMTCKHAKDKRHIACLEIPRYDATTNTNEFEQTVILGVTEH